MLCSPLSSMPSMPAALRLPPSAAIRLRCSSRSIPFPLPPRRHRRGLSALDPLHQLELLGDLLLDDVPDRRLELEIARRELGAGAARPRQVVLEQRLDAPGPRGEH